jgi:hypothetical protein
MLSRSRDGIDPFVDGKALERIVKILIELVMGAESHMNFWLWMKGIKNERQTPKIPVSSIQFVRIMQWSACKLTGPTDMTSAPAS